MVHTKKTGSNQTTESTFPGTTYQPSDFMSLPWSSNHLICPGTLCLCQSFLNPSSITLASHETTKLMLPAMTAYQGQAILGRSNPSACHNGSIIGLKTSSGTKNSKPRKPATTPINKPRCDTCLEKKPIPNMQSFAPTT